MAACKYKVRVRLDVDEDNEEEGRALVDFFRLVTAMLSSIGVTYGGGIALYEVPYSETARPIPPAINAKGGAS